jgi:hypothetical protein
MGTVPCKYIGTSQWKYTVMMSSSSSLLLRIRFSRFTHVFSLAVEDLVSLLGGVVFATLVGLGTSSLG